MDVPVELIQRIQTLLPVEEAARTCVLSKTWSHSWSTIPHLRFDQTLWFLDEEKERDYIKFMYRTMSRYVQDNIPIESFDLKLDDLQSVSVPYEWIRTVVAARLKELSINTSSEFYILLGEIFSGKYLHTLSIENSSVSPKPHVINCVSLRVLKLFRMKISEEVLDTLFSTCTLLERINLSYCKGLKKIKVRSLCYLQQLKLETRLPFDVLKIDDVPNLCYIMPSLLFPSSNALENIEIEVETGDPIDHSFFLMMREALNLSNKFDIKIGYWINETLLIDVNDLEIRFPIPYTNVQHLFFYTLAGKHLPGHQIVIDALLSICRPKYVTIHGDSVKEFSRKFFKLVISQIMAKKKFDQKMMEVKNPRNEKWEVLKNSSWPSFGPYISGGGYNYLLELKPNW
ncbi:putative F-box/LRR-repeat protein At5g02930 [Rutidosis leptorrhynchoides]|uniref:putative F-box/LRR-repeat protein At5g02930 n=1 Tax=Rutidosis leptorrhynchoides TaxID=125765 RepID=UPI003A9A1698